MATIRIADLGHVLARSAVVVEDRTGPRPVSRSGRMLLADALSISSMLFTQEAGPQRAVCAIIGPQSYGWLATLVACVLSGVHVVALPESYTEEQIAHELATLGVTHLVHDPTIKTAVAAAASTVSVIDLATLLAKAGGKTTTVMRPELSALRPSLTITAFTSGTTGKLSSRAFVVVGDSTELFAEEFVRLYGLHQGDVWAVCHSFSHLPHLEYTLCALLQGLNLCVTTPSQLILRAREIRPSAVVGVPALYTQWESRLTAALRHRPPVERRAHGFFSKLSPRLLSSRVVRAAARQVQRGSWALVGGSLKVLIIGAAPSDAHLHRALVAHGLPLYEAYGTSEAGMLYANRPGRARMGTVGTAWPKVEGTVTGAGELVVRTDWQRCLGYVGPTGEVDTRLDSDGVINTGDLVHLDRKGYVQIIGRAKDMIVTAGGKKVNPLPIEESLRDHEEIDFAVVVGEGLSAPRALLVSGADTDAVMRVVTLSNRSLAADARLSHVTILPPDGDMSSLLTRTGKVRRAAVEDLSDTMHWIPLAKWSAP